MGVDAAGGDLSVGWPLRAVLASVLIEHQVAAKRGELDRKLKARADGVGFYLIVTVIFFDTTGGLKG